MATVKITGGSRADGPGRDGAFKPERQAQLHRATADEIERLAQLAVGAGADGDKLTVRVTHYDTSTTVTVEGRLPEQPTPRPGEAVFIEPDVKTKPRRAKNKKRDEPASWESGIPD